MSAVEVFVQNMKPAHHKLTEQHDIRVVDPDLPHIEEEEDDDGYDSEDNENAFKRSQTFTLEEDEILLYSLYQAVKKGKTFRTEKEILNRCHYLLCEWERRQWQWWEDRALLRGVNELLKGTRNVEQGKHYIEEWWFIWKHERDGGIVKYEGNPRTLLYHRSGSECYRRYIELNMESRRNHYNYNYIKKVSFFGFEKLVWVL